VSDSPPPVTELAGPLGPADAAAVRALASAAAERDGIEPLSEQSLLDLLTTGAEHWLVRTVPGSGDEPTGLGLAGYAQLGAASDGTRSAELVVAPQARRAGTGHRLLDAVAARASSGGHRLHVWAHGDLPGAAELARSAGLEPVRDLWRMARALGPGLDGPRVPGLRPFVVGADEESWVELNRRAFAHHPEQGRLTVQDLRAREAEPWFDPGDLLILERDGRAVAYLWLKVEPPVGELYALGVSPEAQGEGLGSLLTAHAVAHLAAHGLDRAVLYTDAAHTAAVRAYTAAGFRRDRVDVQYGPRAPRSSPEDATMPS